MCIISIIISFNHRILSCLNDPHFKFKIYKLYIGILIIIDVCLDPLLTSNRSQYLSRLKSDIRQEEKQESIDRI